jgi:hypothetical protein
MAKAESAKSALQRIADERAAGAVAAVNGIVALVHGDDAEALERNARRVVDVDDVREPLDASMIEAPLTAFSVRRSRLLMTTFSEHATLILGPPVGGPCRTLSAAPMHRCW